MLDHLDRLKMASFPCEAYWLLFPKVINIYLCGARNGKEVYYRILNCREMDLQVLKVMLTWNE